MESAQGRLAPPPRGVLVHAMFIFFVVIVIAVRRLIVVATSIAVAIIAAASLLSGPGVGSKAVPELFESKWALKVKNVVQDAMGLVGCDGSWRV